MSAGTQEDPFAVAELASGIKAAIERGYTRIYVKGEIGGWRVYPSGHAYFTLKDSFAQLQAVMFKSSLERCRAAASLRDGAEILAYANATLYPPRGTCQLVVLAAKPVGEGDLMRRYLELKDKLEKEGLFDRSRKRPLPFLPRRIGLVTSPSGAVVHDMCRVLSRRMPNIEIRIRPAAVQGADAAASVAAGVRYFAATPDGWKPDLVIVARGGGSFEDLFPFCDETLARTVAASPIPVVSAVGHETDFTLCDFAADFRAGTPSIAAETAVPEKRELQHRIARAEASLAPALRAKYQWFAQRIDRMGDAAAAALSRSLSRAETRFAALSAKLDALSPFAVLERGYSITTDASGAAVRDASALSPGDIVETRFAKGRARSRILPAADAEGNQDAAADGRLT